MQKLHILLSEFIFLPHKAGVTVAPSKHACARSRTVDAIHSGRPFHQGCLLASSSAFQEVDGLWVTFVPGPHLHRVSGGLLRACSRSVHSLVLCVFIQFCCFSKLFAHFSLPSLPTLLSLYCLCPFSNLSFLTYLGLPPCLYPYPTGSLDRYLLDVLAKIVLELLYTVFAKSSPCPQCCILGLA